jgi:hypothetical protein
MTSNFNEIKKEKGAYQIKHNVLLIITSLLSILFMTFHVTGDIILGFEKGGTFDLITVPILVVWMYGTLVLTGRRSGYIIILIFSLIGLLAPVLHMRGVGVGGEIAKSSGAFFFIWTLFALGVTSLFSVILSIRGLWSLQRPSLQHP